MDRQQVARWVDAYEQAWRTGGTDHLGDVFSSDVTYRPSPWAAPINGLADLAQFWDAGRDGPDEPFEMTSEVLAVDGETAVVRVEVVYGSPDGGRWRDLWVLRFDSDGQCVAFEEWPFAPGQRNGHEG